MRRLLLSMMVAAIGMLGFALPAHAVTPTIKVQGTYSSFQRAVNVFTSDRSGLAKITVYYSWDHYVHVIILPAGNHVSVLESYTCKNLGPCGDVIRQLGLLDNPGLQNQPHVTINHNVTVTEHPRGTGNTVVDEHYEHGGIPRMELTFKDGHELYINTVNPGYPLGRATAPRVLEFYFIGGAPINKAVYTHD